MSRRDRNHSLRRGTESATPNNNGTKRRRYRRHHHRSSHETRRRKSGCSNRQTRKGAGAVLFTLGIPVAIAGVIMTVVAVTDDDQENKYPKAFLAVGPGLLGASVILFSIGLVLYSQTVGTCLRRCFSLDDPESVCRVCCPNLSQFLKPDDIVSINRAGMKALQAEPGKSVLKRKRDTSISNIESSVQDNTELTQDTDEVFANGHGYPDSAKIQRSVYFSDTDLDVSESFQSSRTSIASESGSIVSLRNCKVHPGDGIWWTDEMSQGSSSKADSSQETVATTEL